jgi:hypothetical protein
MAKKHVFFFGKGKADEINLSTSLDQIFIR